jgi:ABC-type branched-subunit amino acid transport system substrate-binding protein
MSHEFRAGLLPRRGRRLFALGAVVVAGALALTGCASGGSSGSSTSKTINLGISVPLSGAVGSSCTPMNKAMLAWFDHVNATGGVNGAKIKVDTRDDGYDASRAVTNTKAFISDKVLAVTGQCGSLQPPAQIPLLAAAKTPFLFVFGASASLLNPPSQYYYNLMPTYGTQLESAVPFVFKKGGSGSVAIMSTTTPDSVTDAAGITKAVKQGGGKVIGQYSAPPGTADLTPYVLKMKALHPDYVFLDMIPQDAAVLTKAMAANGFSPAKNIVGSNAISQDTFLSTVDPSLASKLLITNDTLVPSSAGKTQCASVLKKANIDVQGVTLRGCGTAQVLVTALKKAKGPLTGQSLLNEIQSWKNVNASEIYKPLSFSSTDHVGVHTLYVTDDKGGQLYSIGTVPVK